MNSDFQGKPSDTSSALAFHMFVSALAKPGADIINTLTPEKMDMIHAAIGISGEAGELLDAVKKIAVYNKPYENNADCPFRINIIEELGDINFYMQMIQQTLFISDAEIIKHNFKKLGKRYEKGYSDAAAQARADKVEEITAADLLVPPLAIPKPVAMMRYALAPFDDTCWHLKSPDGAVFSFKEVGDLHQFAVDNNWNLESYK